MPKIKPIFIVAGLGLAGGIAAAIFFGRHKPPLPPVFQPAANPYGDGIYANGIVESYQSNGENINLYPEVSGTVVEILATEGQVVHKGDPLIKLDDSIQRATVEQLKAQAEAALALLEELTAQPRRENLEIAQAQAESSRASLKNVDDQLAKIRRSYKLNPRSVSRDALDNAANAVEIARKNLLVAEKQLELTRAGAWIFDIRNQQKQYEALLKSAASAEALLRKYTIAAPVDGVVLAIKTAVGSFASPQGVYGTYTQGQNPALVMGGSQSTLAVRTYVDEILVHRMPADNRFQAQMTIRGTDTHIPLEFVRIQPYVTPKIQLSDQRLERVDVRVLPVIFKFDRPRDVNLYPGQLVDVFMSGAQVAQLPGSAQPSPAPSPAEKLK